MKNSKTNVAKALLCVVALGASLMLTGCTKTEKTVGGAAVGAGLGTAIGVAAGGGVGGALGGAALGGIAGGLVGNSMGDDKK